MIGAGVTCSILRCVVIATSIDSVAASQSAFQKDAEAVAIAQAASRTMSGTQAIAGCLDFQAEETLMLSAANPVSYSITVKTKGLREARTEVLILAALHHLNMAGNMLAKAGNRVAGPRHSTSVIGHNATEAMDPKVDCAIAQLDLSGPVSLILTLALRNGAALTLRPTHSDREEPLPRYRPRFPSSL
jgi:hypothetical protein